MKPLPTTRTVLRHAVLAATIGSLLASCTTAPVPEIRREGDLIGSRVTGVNTAANAVNATPAADAAPAASVNAATAPAVTAAPLPEDDAGPKAQIRRGTGQVINRAAATARRPMGGGSSGAATFNFEGESLHAVVKAILGDMLGQNYVIAPNVQGTVTLATPKPVSSADALRLLEMVLAWNNARLIYSEGRYSIVPADQALAGNAAPRTGPALTARGFEVRTVPLKYVSATEMKKILEPYARPNAIVNVDNGRNIISVAGSQAELENYLRTIEIFDVDWLSGMSVGVFPLSSGRATRVVADLERVFGEQSKSPVAGMFRFMPLEGANAIMVITSQADYLDDIQQWLERIDSAGGQKQLYSYELKYIKARDLANQLSEVFGGGAPGGSEGGGAPSLMPGLDPVELQDRDGGSTATIGGQGGDGFSGDSAAPAGTGGNSGSLQLGAADNRNGSVTLEVEGDRVGVSAVAETNTLLVRASPQAWKSIKDVIERLDTMPLQVHIEAQVVEVQLSGALEYGVTWFFENAVSDAVADGGAGLPSAEGRDIWGDLRGSVRPASSTGGIGGLAWTFLGRDAAAVISALDQVTDLQVLQTPSVFVRNNAEATLNVGSRIPIESVTVDPGTGAGGVAYSQVQYLDTGIILKVRPRITREGMVFLDIVQEVSSPGAREPGQRNVRIDTRRVKTETAVPDGNTVMLAGLISDGVTRGSSGLPGLSRIPVIGGLFGRQTSRTERNEVIVLLTPKVVRNPLEARELTDEYGRRFRALEPLYRGTAP
jgi:general secretion pathway protein D